MQTRTEDRLLNSHDRDLLKLIDSSSIVSITDVYGRIIYVNDNFLKITGNNKQNIIGEPHKLIKSQLHTDSLYKELWGTIKTGNIWKGVLPGESTKGEMFFLETTILPIKNLKGEILRYASTYVDVTSYYKNNDIINNKQSESKNLVEKIMNVVLSVNNYGKILNACNGDLNIDYNEIIGAYVYDFLDPLSHTMAKKNIKKVFNERKQSEYESIGMLANGEQSFYVSKVDPVFNNQDEVIFVTITTQKITKEKKIAKELETLEAKYRTIFQSKNAGIIVVTNHTGNITEWNKGAELSFGYEESEVIGEPLTMLISKKHRKTSIKELVRAKKKLNDYKKGETIEMVGLQKNGNEFPVEFALSNWGKEEDGFYCAIMLDITKRKDLENKLMQKTKELELFLYRSAHDLKEPLSSAEGLIYLIKGEKVNKKVQVLTDMLDITIGRGRLLLDNLTLASVVVNKKKEIHSIDFSEIVENTLKDLEGLKNFDFIKFQISINQSKSFFSNHELIGSIFKNLIQNAINYSKPITSSHQPNIKIGVCQTNNGIKIIISDNGFGIPKDSIDKIFNLYYKSNNEDIYGTGIGLYIVKSIVENFNGKIKVSSELNKGAHFEISLSNPNFIKK